MVVRRLQGLTLQGPRLLGIRPHALNSKALECLALGSWALESQPCVVWCPSSPGVEALGVRGPLGAGRGYPWLGNIGPVVGGAVAPSFLGGGPLRGSPGGRLLAGAPQAASLSGAPPRPETIPGVLGIGFPRRAAWGSVGTRAGKGWRARNCSNSSGNSRAKTQL